MFLKGIPLCSMQQRCCLYCRNVPPYLPVHLFLVRLQIDEDDSPPLCYFVACKVKTFSIETDLPVK